MSTSKLADDQIAAFDREDFGARYWLPVKRAIDRDYPSGQFSFLDLGGGNGLFSDIVLSTYPKATGTLLDASELLLSKNKPSERKTIVQGDATSLAHLRGTFDIVFCNWLLHHLVLSGRYWETRANIHITLKAIRSKLNSGGRLSIHEQEYTGWIDSLPSKAIFAATSSKVLASLTRRFGANTAGVGVCFLSHRMWLYELQKAGYELLAQNNIHPIKVSRLHKAAFQIRHSTSVHYWLSAATHESEHVEQPISAQQQM